MEIESSVSSDYSEFDSDDSDIGEDEILRRRGLVTSNMIDTYHKKSRKS